MSEMKKDTFMQKIKNKGLVYASAIAIAGCTGLVLLAKGCPPGSFTERPTLCEPVRGDNRCCESESFPFQRNPNGTVKMRNGQPVPNPDYSLEDCHGGDNVCQNQGSLAEMRDAAGQPVSRIMERFLDGRQITLPLEDANSIDCVMQAVREMPCAAVDPANPQYIDRPKVTGLLVPHTMRQRTQPEIESMSLQPGALHPGDNYFVVISNYEEVCQQPGDALRLCEATSLTACACPNLRACAQTPCGNSRIDQGEKCDGSASPTGCGTGTRCNSTCTQCNPVKQCGNGRIDRNLGERCDSTASPTGCNAGQTCAPGCQACTGGETHNACRNEQCVSVPGAGRNSCSTNDDCATEVPPPPPPPPPSTGCPSEILGRFQNRVASSLSRRGDEARGATSASSSTTVRARVNIVITNGVPAVGSISLSCAGCSNGSLSAGSLSLAGIPIAPGTTCNGPLYVNIPPG